MTTKDNDKYGLTDATDKDKNNTQPPSPLKIELWII